MTMMVGRNEFNDDTVMMMMMMMRVRMRMRMRMMG